MHYIWFWTFWHWSKESFNSGIVLRGPLQGIASHWDEWFHHEASESDKRAIQFVGSTESRQRQFMSWLRRHWALEADPSRNRLVPRFVLGRLAQVPPFNGWAALTPYRTSYGIGGVQAIILAEKSAGEPEDIRTVEALALPRDNDVTAAAIVAEEFHAEPSDLERPLETAKRLLSAKCLAGFIAQWVVCGRRPCPRWLASTLILGWAAVAVLILLLVFGPEPGNNLFFIELGLVALWLGLMLAAIVVVAVVVWRAWRIAIALRTRLENSQIRLRMNGGLTLKGGSAGLPFCLGILSSLYRAYPQDARTSWLWQRFLRKLCSAGRSWAATGVLTADGRIRPVVLEPKLRACLRQGAIKHILTPRQGPSSKVYDTNPAWATTSSAKEVSLESGAPRLRFGFAAESPQLEVHRCADIAGAVMILGDFIDRQQVVKNVFALVLSISMIFALPDLRSALLPYPAPKAVLPTSSSPYYLWVSLDTKHPEYFSVVLESDYWSNRRVDVQRSGGLTPSFRAEMHFHRLTGMTSANEDNGVVWIERKPRFLTREFFPGERVGRYSIPYLTHLGHE